MQVSMQTYRKPLLVLAALVLTAALASAIPALLQRMEQRTPQTVNAASVAVLQKTLRLAREGTAVHATMVPVYTEGAGRVTDVYVSAGQSVKAGQALVKLELSGGRDVTVAAGAPTVPAASGSRDVYENALKEYTRYQKLYEQGAVARRQLEAAEARLKAAEAATGEGVPAAAATAAPRTLPSGPVTIQASIDGTVSGTVVAAGSQIQAGQELLALGSGQAVEIVMPLEQRELYFVPLGAPVNISVNEQTVTGQVSGIYPEFKDNQLAAFVAHVKLPEGNTLGLTPGAKAKVVLSTEQKVGVTAVPQRAVRQDEPGQAYVFLIVGDKAVRQDVTLGEVLGEYVEITSALPVDGVVVASDVQAVRQGDTLVIRQAE